jgi:hypothetical protein
MAARKNENDGDAPAPQQAAEQDRKMGNETALKMLRFLLKEGPGNLRIITNERSEVPERELLPRGGNGNPLADPRAYVLHDVVEIEGPDAAGMILARSAEKDAVLGYPAGVLDKLTEHTR